MTILRAPSFRPSAVSNPFRSLEVRSILLLFKESILRFVTPLTALHQSIPENELLGFPTMESTYFPVLGPIPAIIPIYVGGIAVLLYLSYRWALVKPIPGIPFNESAANTILGDVPDFMKWIKRTSQTYTWISHQNVKLNSPIVQVFVRPFSKPWVVISDFRETQDICLRRTKEFDRSNFFGDVFVGVIPDHHIDKLSKDLAFKRNRNLVNHLMAPAFLKNVGSSCSSFSTANKFH